MPQTKSEKKATGAVNSFMKNKPIPGAIANMLNTMINKKLKGVNQKLSKKKTK